MAWKRILNRRLEGYTTVFLAMILAVFMLTSLVIVEYAAGFASASVAENVCAVAGRSVLSEYQTELFKRYGLFALHMPDNYIEEKAEFYLRHSLVGQKGIIKIRPSIVSADSSDYFLSDNDEFERQIACLSLGINDYILKYCSSQLKQFDDTSKKLEAEYIICGKASDEKNEDAIKDRIFASRFAADLAEIYADDVQLQEIRAIAEVVLPGVGAEIAVFTVASVKASEKANEEVNKILSGQTVPIIKINGLESFGTYNDYLWSFLLLTPKSTKINRLKRVMEENLFEIDNVDFSFSDCVFGFDLCILYSKKASAKMIGITRRERTVNQTFTYK